MTISSKRLFNKLMVYVFVFLPSLNYDFTSNLITKMLIAGTFDIIKLMEDIFAICEPIPDVYAIIPRNED